MNITTPMLTGLAVAGFLLIVGIDRADAAPKQIKGTISGTFFSSSIDKIPDGMFADVSMGEVVERIPGQTGKHHGFQSLSEPVPIGSSDACPFGEFIIDADHADGPQGYGQGTETYPTNGDQLYSVILDRKVCMLNANGEFTLHETGEIVGGSGKLAGASGTIETDLKGFYQVLDLTTGKGFGSFTGTFTKNITVPLAP